MIRKTALPLLLTLALSAGCGHMHRGPDDRAIETDVRNRINTVMSGHVYTANVAVSGGVVTLTGTTRTEEEKRAIGDAANKATGLTTVINNIQVQPGQ